MDVICLNFLNTYVITMKHTKTIVNNLVLTKGVSGGE